MRAHIHTHTHTCTHTHTHSLSLSICLPASRPLSLSLSLTHTQTHTHTHTQTHTETYMHTPAIVHQHVHKTQCAMKLSLAFVGFVRKHSTSLQRLRNMQLRARHSRVQGSLVTSCPVETQTSSPNAAYRQHVHTTCCTVYIHIIYIYLRDMFFGNFEALVTATFVRMTGARSSVRERRWRNRNYIDLFSFHLQVGNLKMAS